MSYREDVQARLKKATTPDALGQTIVAISKGQDDRTKMEEIRDIIATFLDHPDDYVRHEALLCLGVSWGFAEYKERYIKMLGDDISEQNRWTAASSLGSSLKGTKDPEALRALALTVSNESELSIVRATAYAALIRVQDKSRYREALRLPDNIEDIDVNWPLIQALLR